MLSLDHAQAIDLLTSIDQPWREDTMNQTHGWRARLRSAVLPVLRDLRPSAAAKSADTAHQLHLIARFMSRLARRFEHQHLHTCPLGSPRFHRSALAHLDPAMLSLLLRRQSRRMSVPADALGQSVLRPIVHAIRSPDRSAHTFSLAAGVTLSVSCDAITWHRPTTPGSPTPDSSTPDAPTP
jgi:hypothetical protein